MGKKKKKTGYSGACPDCGHRFVGAMPNRCSRCNFPLKSKPQKTKKGKTKMPKKKKNGGRKNNGGKKNH